MCDLINAEGSELQAMRVFAVAGRANCWALVTAAAALACSRDHSLPFEIKSGLPSLDSPGMETFYGLVCPGIAEELGRVARERGFHCSVRPAS